jgi:hypothetical protein
MFWLSISNVSPALEPIAAHSRPWSTVKKFWQFCNSYGEYQATPPGQRRQFILNMEQALKQKPCRSDGL